MSSSEFYNISVCCLINVNRELVNLNEKPNTMDRFPGP